MADPLTMVDITPAELSAAEKIFGDRLDLAKRYVEHLATSGTERGLIDRLKQRVPIWKHQLFADGTDEWVGTP